MSNSSVHSKAVGLIQGRDNPMVFDVGANEGGWSRSYLSVLPRRKLQMFEPLPALAGQLRADHAKDPDVGVHELVLTDRVGKISFHFGGFSPVSSIFPRNQSGHRYFDPSYDLPQQIERPCTTLDRFCADQSINQIDLLKLDTQGAEATILRGAKTLLADQAIDVVLTEFFCVPHYEGAALLFDVWKEMDAAGYSMFDMEQGLYAPNGQLRFGDAVFVSDKMRRTQLS